MANPHGVPGIKLFGTTIKLQEQGAEDRVKDDDGDDQDQDHEAKRPEKIIACPRCKSMETKFCYFNNYNVNQPRHFCKGCQRYWTAGGALRNVPVGAGRRKAKPPCRDQLLEGCLYDAAGVQGFDLWEDWHVASAAVQGGFRHAFPVKRRRNDSGGHQSS